MAGTQRKGSWFVLQKKQKPCLLGDTPDVSVNGAGGSEGGSQGGAGLARTTTGLSNSSAVPSPLGAHMDTLAKNLKHLTGHSAIRKMGVQMGRKLEKLTTQARDAAIGVMRLLTRQCMSRACALGRQRQVITQTVLAACARRLCWGWTAWCTPRSTRLSTTPTSESECRPTLARCRACGRLADCQLSDVGWVRAHERTPGARDTSPACLQGRGGHHVGARDAARREQRAAPPSLHPREPRRLLCWEKERGRGVGAGAFMAPAPALLLGPGRAFGILHPTGKVHVWDSASGSRKRRCGVCVGLRRWRACRRPQGPTPTRRPSFRRTWRPPLRWPMSPWTAAAARRSRWRRGATPPCTPRPRGRSRPPRCAACAVVRQGEG